MENRNTPTNPAPYVLEGYANILVDGYDGTIQQHRVVDGHKLRKEGYRLWQLFPEVWEANRDYKLVIGYSIANELEISKRSIPPHEIPYVLLTEQGLLMELRDALEEKRTLSTNQRKFMADLTSDKHEQYRKILEEIIEVAQFSAFEHDLEKSGERRESVGEKVG